MKTALSNKWWTLRHYRRSGN